jgi:hypothetical protein
MPTTAATSGLHPAPELTLADHELLVASLRTRLGADSVVQTPISSVLLSADRAWKLKKPVRLAFIDCSTAERRAHFCAEEWRLNRRTAAPLYLGVRAVTGTLQAPEIDGPGARLDTVVEMRRFDAGEELRALARRGALGPDLVDALAAHLVGFHRSLEPLPESRWPRKQPWDWARETIDELEAMAASGACGTCSSVGGLQALRERLGAAFAALAPALEARAQAGHLREGHGDLHLGNLVRWQGSVMAFDALEFEPALRCIDLVCDVAFTFMDLLAHGLDGHAWRFINAWAEGMDEWLGLSALRPFAAYRALVRAKVAALAGEGAAFDRYFALAATLAAPPPRPRLVVMTGLSGSGKSAVAARLSERLGALRLRSDVERKRLMGLAPTERAAPGSLLAQRLYGAEATAATYARLLSLADALLQAGHSVVLDAAFLRQHERAAAQTLADRRGAAFALVHCWASVPVLRARLAARAQHGADPSDATEAVLEVQQGVAEPWPADWAPWVHEIDNRGDEAALDAAVSRLMADWTRNGAGRAAEAPETQVLRKNGGTPA